MPVIGFLSSLRGPTPQSSAAFLQGLSQTGYVEGKNVAIEYRWAGFHNDQLPGLAADLVSRKVDVIVASGSVLAVLAAKSATSAIPIVFPAISDPVGSGLVESLAHPGGNITGFSPFQFELMPKRLELLTELVPQARVIALLVNPNDPRAERHIKDMLEATRRKGLKLQTLTAGTESEIDAAFPRLVELHAGALLVSPDPFFNLRREQIVTLASRHAIPAIYEWREFAVAGGLISYGTSLPGMYHLAGGYVGRILNGVKPADLPIEQPTKFELVINLKTAKALGLTIPPVILARADEVIE